MSRLRGKIYASRQRHISSFSRRAVPFSPKINEILARTIARVFIFKPTSPFLFFSFHAPTMASFTPAPKQASANSLTPSQAVDTPGKSPTAIPRAPKIARAACCGRGALCASCSMEPL